MRLKFSVDSLESVDEGVRNLYAKHDDGRFYLDVEGAVAKSRLDEFRNNNVKLLQERDELAKKYKDIDPDRYLELAAKAKELEGKETVTKAEMEELVQSRIAQTVAEYKDQISKAEELSKKLRGQLSEALIDNQVRTLGIKYGVREAADTDLVNRARATFRLDEETNTPVPYDGENVIYGKDGRNPLTVDEWMAQQREKEATHLFNKSTGSGAPGSGPGSRRVDPSSMTPLQKITSGMVSRGG